VDRAEGQPPRGRGRRESRRGRGHQRATAGGGRYAGAGGAPAAVETREGRRWRQPERQGRRRCDTVTREGDGRWGARGLVLELRDFPAISENERVFLQSCHQRRGSEACATRMSSNAESEGNPCGLSFPRWSITSSEQNTCSPMCVYMPACLAIDLKRATSSINEVSQPIVDSFLVSPTWEPMLLRLQGRQEGQRSQSRRCRQQESPLLRRRRHRRLRRRQLPLHRRC
jgi:hypothetical protein